jgi:puromycin-sensitive aminopeptidase
MNRTRWKTTEFESTPIMSTYLLAFAVADFQNITERTEDGKKDFSVYSSKDALSGMRFALEIGQKALKALEEYIEHDYTLGKIDFIAIDDFLMGAMENWV